MCGGVIMTTSERRAVSGEKGEFCMPQTVNTSREHYKRNVLAAYLLELCLYAVNGIKRMGTAASASLISQ